jgi:[acyl-carrier-protein] S-malonyltransferase
MQGFLFSGQGSQKENMGIPLAQANRKAALIYEEASDLTGIDILSLSGEQLEQTRYAQLAIVTMSVAAWSAYTSVDAESAAGHAFAGFSLGEYSALTAAGVIDLHQLIDLVTIRSQLMQEAADETPGTMFAIIGMSDDAVEEVLNQSQFSGRVFPVNYNCPGQLVISGLAQPAEEAAEALLAAGARRSIKLNVSGAFHTPFMESAAVKLREYAANMSFGQSNGIIYSNANAATVSTDINWPEHIYQHMISPVRWTDEIRQMQSDGCEKFIEFGYGKVLQGLVRKIDRNAITAVIDGSIPLEDIQ